MKIALYKRMGDYEYESVNEVTDYHESGDYGWVRISEAIKVEFTRLPSEVIVPKEVACLEAAKEEVMAKYLDAIEQIDEKISKLLAIEDKSNV